MTTFETKFIWRAAKSGVREVLVVAAITAVATTPTNADGRPDYVRRSNIEPRFSISAECSCSSATKLQYRARAQFVGG